MKSVIRKLAFNVLPILISLSLLIGCSSKTTLQSDVIKNAVDFAGKQLEQTSTEMIPGMFPKATTADGTWTTESISNKVGWTMGFFPGSLWYMYNLTGDKTWKTKAEEWTESLDAAKTNTESHDMGFIFMSSYGNGLSMAKEKGYKDVMLTAARSLSTLYSPDVKAIRIGYWGDWSYPVFIDTMMNTQLLFWASENGLGSRYKKMALDHCLTTGRDLVRKDGSTYHCVDYDPVTGDIIKKQTYQGFADESTWARGQSWALYGFTAAYRYTHDKRMLDYAVKVANYYVKNLPKDGVPYWDFNAPDIPDALRDSSAAAASASGLLELSTLVNDKKLKAKYWDTAVKTLKKLCSNDYLAKGAVNKGILKHAVGFYTENVEIDVSLVYADYYFLEALSRYQKLK